MSREINATNYHDSTSANFRTLRKAPDRAPDFVSPSGSRYWHTDEGLIRQSNHWVTSINSCSWPLGGKAVEGVIKVGFCAWEDFADKEAGQRCAAHEKLHAKWSRQYQRRQRFDAALRTPGAKVRATRTVTERFGRSFSTRVEKVSFTVARATAKFVVTSTGERYAFSTLSL